MTAIPHLSLWNENATRSAITQFVEKVTNAGSPEFIPPMARIATFDNDGTLWLEKPMYIQLQHGLRVIGKMAAEQPTVRDRQPFKAVYEKDRAWLAQVADDYARGDPGGFLTLAEGIAEACAGISVEDFDADALKFLTTNQDDRFKMPYKQLIYKPMVELVHYLQENDFQVYLTSAGGRDFMRAVSDEIYGVPRAMVIGSSVMTEFKEDTRGDGCMMRTKQIEQPIDDGSGKPPHIHRAIGRRPIFAAGNSNGDIEMFKYATMHEGPSFALLVHHDDDVREYSYDGGAEKALRLAKEMNWTVTSMRNDWKTIF